MCNKPVSQSVGIPVSHTVMVRQWVSKLVSQSVSQPFLSVKQSWMDSESESQQVLSHLASLSISLLVQQSSWLVISKTGSEWISLLISWSAINMPVQIVLSGAKPLVIMITHDKNQLPGTYNYIIELASDTSKRRYLNAVWPCLPFFSDPSKIATRQITPL